MDGFDPGDQFTLQRVSNNLLLSFVPAPLVGDYNGDGAVDAADYTVWRDNLGGNAATEFAAGSRDVSNSGPINQDDYAAWKNNFGSPGAAAAAFESAAVPEPSTLVMLLLAAVGLRRVRVARTNGGRHKRYVWRKCSAVMPMA